MKIGFQSKQKILTLEGPECFTEVPIVLNCINFVLNEMINA